MICENVRIRSFQRPNRFSLYPNIEPTHGLCSSRNSSFNSSRVGGAPLGRVVNSRPRKSRTRITFRMPISWMAPFSIWLNEERPIPTAFAASDWVTFCLFLASRIERPMANSTLHLSPVSNTKYFVYFCKYVYYM